jgi:hypothetical protein
LPKAGHLQLPRRTMFPVLAGESHETTRKVAERPKGLLLVLLVWFLAPGRLGDLYNGPLPRTTTGWEAGEFCVRFEIPIRAHYN